LMAMEADRMTGLRIEDADVASERAVVLEEFRRGEVAITVELSKKMLKALYENSPQSRTVIGADTEIVALDGRKAQSFYERFYGPGRATVILAGDITEAEARSLTEASYGRVPVRTNLAPRVVSAVLAQGVSVRVEGSHERATAVLVNRIFAVPGVGVMSRRDAYAANLFAYVAGNGMTSRLHRRLLAEQAIASSVGCSFAMGADVHTLDCFTWGKVGTTVDQLEPAFIKVLAELVEGGISDDEFDEIKSRFLATTPYRNDNVYSRAMGVGSLLAEGLSIADIEALESDVASLTRADLERVARKILKEGRSVTGVLTPKAAAPVVAPAAAKVPSAN
jgi:zinc protease